MITQTVEYEKGTMKLTAETDDAAQLIRGVAYKIMPDGTLKNRGTMKIEVAKATESEMLAELVKQSGWLAY